GARQEQVFLSTPTCRWSAAEPEFLEDKRPDTPAQSAIHRGSALGFHPGQGPGREIHALPADSQPAAFAYCSAPKPCTPRLYSLDEQGRWVLTETREPRASARPWAALEKLPAAASAAVYERVTLARQPSRSCQLA
ncbi:MAG: hypothetical protein WKG07_21610, partial [Hymenobacter sp.]